MSPQSPQSLERFVFRFRRTHAARASVRGLMELVPVVDLVLLLVLFLLLNSRFVLQPGIAVNLPDAPFEDGAAYYGALLVTVTQEGMVFFNDERTALEGLAAEFAQAAHDDPEAHVLIEADARVTHGLLVEAYNMARDAGIKKVTLATRLPARPEAAP